MTVSGYFDVIHGASLYGWACDSANLDAKLMVEAVTDDGRVLGIARADLFRGDLVTAGYGDGRNAYRIELNGNIADLVGVNVSTRPVGGAGIFPGSPRPIILNPNFHYLLTRNARARPILAKLRARLDREAGQGGISIVMPIYNTPQAWLIEALESVRAQWCSKWQLICVDDGSTAPHVASILKQYARADSRIKVFTAPQNVGIARATNIGLRAASHDYVAFMDHDDYLEPHAVWSLIRAAQKSGAELIYSDEVLTSESIFHILDVRARPAFSYDYYLSHPYFVHMLCIKRDLAHRAHGWDEGMAISADVDFVLRIIEAARTVAHVPSVLYRWRTHGASAGHVKQEAVTKATTASIQKHLDRVHANAVASPGVAFNQFHVTWPVPSGRTLIIIPTKNGVNLLRMAIKSIEKTAKRDRYHIVIINHQSDDPKTKRYLTFLAKRHTVMPYSGAFNFSRMNNVAAARYGKDYDFVLFMNNDVEATHCGWLERLMSLAARPDVGAVGPALLFSDRRIQHAGVIIGYSDAAEHVGKFVGFEDETGARTLGANCTLSSVRDFSAVTGACLMMRMEVFRELDGYREEFAVAFNDTDLCLRARAKGYRVLYDGHTSLYHHESATRAHTNDLVHPKDTLLFQQTWQHLMGGHDPFYHPTLSLTVQDHILAEKLVVAQAAPRIVTLRKEPA